MYRDASIKTQDMLVLQEMSLDVINTESLRAYRQRMRLSKPGHVWDTLDDEHFLIKLGAAAIGEDSSVHPTAAGLLMFGNESDIVREYPRYFLDYREEYDDVHRWTDRVISSSGDWSGNVFDFYFRVYNKLQLDLKVPFEMDGIYRVDDTPVHRALREALANCLVNADYYGRQGLVIIKKKDVITMTNPGDFRIGLSAARSGGVSDPRNGTMMKMFNLIDIGERAGSGIPNIFSVWKQQGWSDPTITISSEPDRSTLILPLIRNYYTDVAIKNSDNEKNSDKKVAIKTERNKNIIIAYLTDHASAKVSDFEPLLGIKAARIRRLLSEMIAEGVVVAEGGNRNRTYRLKS